MAKHKEVPIKTLDKILDEVELGLNDKSRTSSSVTDPTIKAILSNSQKAAVAAGIGGAAVAAAGVGAAALAAGGIGVAAGGGFALAGGAALAVAAGGGAAGGGLLAGALAILGGPIGWAAAGGAVIITVLVGVVKKKEKKNKKIVLFQDAIAKQNRIIKEQADTIEKLKKMQHESEVQKQKMAKVIDELIARIDYLTSLLIATEAVKEACA